MAAAATFKRTFLSCTTALPVALTGPILSLLPLHGHFTSRPVIRIPHTLNVCVGGTPHAGPQSVGNVAWRAAARPEDVLAPRFGHPFQKHRFQCLRTDRGRYLAPTGQRGQQHCTLAYWQTAEMAGHMPVGGAEEIVKMQNENHDDDVCMPR